MLAYLQNITKNQQFVLSFSCFAADESTKTPTVIKISKDGAAFTTTTNSAVAITAPGDWYGELAFTVTLTAAEMNADRVVVACEKATSGNALSLIHIYTTSGGGAGITAADVWAYSTRSLTGASGDAISLEDVIEDKADLPNGDLTVRQVLELIAKRFKRSGRSSKL